MDVSTTPAGRAADRRRRTTTDYRDADGVIGTTHCHLLPIDGNHYTLLDNGSLSVRFPDRHRGVYAVGHYFLIAGTPHACTETAVRSLPRVSRTWATFVFMMTSATTVDRFSFMIFFTVKFRKDPWRKVQLKHVASP